MIRLSCDIPPISAENTLLCALSGGNAYETDGGWLYPDGGRLIIGGLPTDLNEVVDFARFNGCKTALCEHNCNISGNIVQSGETLCFHGTGGGNSADIFPDYKSVYSLMSDCFSLPDYDSFLSVLHERIRAGNARVYSSDNSAAIVFNVGDIGFLNAICTREPARSNGEGSVLLSRLCNDFERLYLYKKTGQHDRFYQNAGFVKCSQFNIKELYFD